MMHGEHKERRTHYKERNFHCIHSERETVKIYPSGLRKERCTRCLHFIMTQNGESVVQLSFIDVLMQKD